MSLTRRETQVMELICEGCSVKEIGPFMRISNHTVKSHLKSVHRKLGARNGKHAVALYMIRVRNTP
jgi:DNA-binding CsgD family transcriptional regulator